MSDRSHSVLGLIGAVFVAAVAMQGFTQWSLERLGARTAANARPGDIRMIASAACAYCAAVRAWLTDNHIPFTECEIESDAACARQYSALLAPGTPLLGFNARAVADALATRAR